MKKPNKTTVCNLRLSDSLAKRADRKASKEGVTRSELLRQALESFLGGVQCQACGGTGVVEKKPGKKAEKQ